MKRHSHEKILLPGNASICSESYMSVTNLVNAMLPFKPGIFLLNPDKFPECDFTSAAHLMPLTSHEIRDKVNISI